MKLEVPLEDLRGQDRDSKRIWVLVEGYITESLHHSDPDSPRSVCIFLVHFYNDLVPSSTRNSTLSMVNSSTPCVFPKTQKLRLNLHQSTEYERWESLSQGKCRRS